MNSADVIISLRSITIRHTTHRPVSRSRRVSHSDEPVEVSASSGSRSFSDSTAEDGWTDVGGYSDDGIEPDDSASRSRHHSRHRAPAPEAPAAPRRRTSSRRPVEREHSRHRSSSHRVRHRRPSSDQSDSVDHYEDYPGHARTHHPHPHPHHPRGHSNPGWAHVPHHVPPGGFTPIMSNAGYHTNPFANSSVLPPNNMMIPYPPDPYGFPGQNPFAPPMAGQPNPFSPPATSSTSSGYFSHDPRGGPYNSMARPGHPGYGGQEMMPYSPGGYYNTPYGPQPYHPQSVQWAYHQSPPSTLAYESMRGSKDMSNADKLEKLEKLILKQKEEQLEREKAAEEKRLAELKEKEKAAAEIVAAEAAAAALITAAKKARDDAEKEAADKAKEAKKGHEKELAEAKAAATAAKAEAEALKPKGEEKQAPIRFKDAVGRKFNFPFHMCKTWKGMEELIKQAFLHVDKIGPHVQEGHYDLMGPNGEIILPAVWDTTIEPDWAITMLMWPLPATPPAAEVEVVPPPPPAPGHLSLVKKSNSKKVSSKSSSKTPYSPPVVMVPIPPPPAPGPPPSSGVGSDVVVVEMSPAVAAVVEHGEHAAKSKRSQPIPPLLAWTAGGGVRKAGTSLKGVKKPEAGQAHDASCVVM